MFAETITEFTEKLKVLGPIENDYKKEKKENKKLKEKEIMITE
jgi:hypothetical protein